MNSLNLMNYSNNNLQKHVMSASTKRKLESLGIDPTLVCDESQAKSLIQTRETEKSFKHYEQTIQPEIKSEEKKNPELNLDSEFYSAMTYNANNIRFLLGL